VSEYWRNYWNECEITNNSDAQKSVGRTRNSQAVAHDAWEKTLALPRINSIVITQPDYQINSRYMLDF